MMEYIYHGHNAELPCSVVSQHLDTCTMWTSEHVIEYLETAVNRRDGDLPLVLVDFGTGDGVLALRTFKLVIDTLRNVQNDKREVIVVLNDVDDGNLGLLSKNIKDFQLHGTEGVTVLMSVTDFFSPALPDAFIDVATSNLSLHYISSLPIKKELFIACTDVTDRERAVYEIQASENWRNFLRSRSQELKPGGRLFVSFMMKGSYDNGRVFQMMSDAWKDMYSTGIITESEFMKGTVGQFHHTKDDIMSPFIENVYSDLRVVSFNVQYPSSYWVDTDSKGNPTPREYAEKMINIIRSFSNGYMKTAFNESFTRTCAEKEELVDMFYRRSQIAVEESGHVASLALHVGHILLQKAV